MKLDTTNSYGKVYKENESGIITLEQSSKKTGFEFFFLKIETNGQKKKRKPMNKEKKDDKKN